MYLERVEISGFRGINRLSLSLTQNTVLIGENAWGKSSLLDALTLLLSPLHNQCEFKKTDFYHPKGDDESKSHHLQIVLTFCETRPGRSKSIRFRKLSPVWIGSDDNLNRIHYRVSADIDHDEKINRQNHFLNGQGEILNLNNSQRLVDEIIRLYPVIRLRDARFMRSLNKDVIDTHQQAERELFNEKMEQLTGALINNPQKLSDDELNQGLDAMRQLLSHYFSEQGAYLFRSNKESERNKKNLHFEPRQRGWQALESINRIVAKPNQRNTRLIILGMFSSLLQSNSGINLDKHARPLVIVEDPETRLHPIMLSVAWGLLNLFSLQRITTTNSGELLSLVPLRDVCRLVRESNRVAAFRLGENNLSAEEMRRVSFHIRFNRPSALFARCWLLVEGETEIWLMNDLAKQCNYFFETEGIKVIEFAQCGLKPLLKFASLMGIEWHTLVDGDDAGKKYAATAEHFASLMNDVTRDRVTRLPAPDMEHFLYREGFSHVYHSISQIPDNYKVAPRRVIIKAVQRASKPDLAIAVATDAAERGVESIPPILRRMFSRVAWLARGRAN